MNDKQIKSAIKNLKRLIKEDRVRPALTTDQDEYFRLTLQSKEKTHRDIINRVIALIPGEGASAMREVLIYQGVVELIVNQVSISLTTHHAQDTTPKTITHRLSTAHLPLTHIFSEKGPK